MRGAYLPGGSQIELRDVPIPTPGIGQLLVRMRASSICGSDLRAIYREHTGRGAEAYRDVIGGHEPCGEVAEVGPGCRRFAVGDRVVVYHIAGCGVCRECRLGSMVSCTSPLRAAYGWQRDGGHADYMVADEQTCLALPDQLSFVDGACVACGFGTAYEALCKVGLSGRDRIAIIGLGPVGMAVGMLARALGASLIAGVDIRPERRDLATRLGTVDLAMPAGDEAVESLQELTRGHGFEVTLDCSGSTRGRALAIAATRPRGRCALVGEGGRIEADASPALIHPQLMVTGSWVTTLWRMEDLLDQLVRWDLHPERTVTDRMPLARAQDAYRIADEGGAGKVAITMGP